MIRIFAIALALVSSAGAALAAPSVIPYAGYLSDAEGAPYEGSVDVRAAIYGCATQAEACPQLWQASEQTGLDVNAGILRFELGDEGDASFLELLTGPGPFWLDIELRTEGAEAWTPLEPRHGLHAVPFAIGAVNAERLGGMDAADYATAAEIAVFTTLEEISAAGYLTDTQLADAGYLVSDALAPYVTSEALEAMGYATSGDVTEAIADKVTTSVLQTTLEAYVTSEALTGTLQDYITATALSEALQPYLLAADVYTDQEALAAVDAAGYALSSELPTQYTDELALEAVEAAGYAKEEALMRMLSGLVFGAAAKASQGTSSSASTTVQAGDALNHILVDVNISDTLEYEPPSEPETNPSKEHHTYVICNANLRQNDEVITLSQPSSLVAGEHLFDKDAVTIDRTELLTMTLFANVPSEWKASPFDVELDCTPVCTSIGSSATCDREVQVSFVTRTF